MLTLDTAFGVGLRLRGLGGLGGLGGALVGSH